MGEPLDLAQLGGASLTLFFGLLGLVLALILLLLGFGWWWTHRQGSHSPYGGGYLRKGSELDYRAVERVQRFLLDQDPMPNPPFDFNQASVCVRTGRIFPDTVNRMGVIRLPRRFFELRAKDWVHGRLISWGSLDEGQRSILGRLHSSLEGFQTEASSRRPNPEDTERRFWEKKPGPLYVNLSTAVLVGWKCVPGTDLELLVIQRPTGRPSNF